MSAISQNLGSRLLAGGGPTRTASLASGTGLAAGGAAGAWNGWASYSGDNSSYKVSRLTVNGVANNIDNQNMVDNLVLGGDYRIAPAMVLVLSSGDDEPVSDEGKGGHSVFAWNLARVLDSLDAMAPGYTVWKNVHGQVTKEAAQEPQYGAVISAGHDPGGEYLFQPR